MRVLCVGAGAVGCLVSARLAAAGNDVVLLARPDRAPGLRSRGLTLHDAKGRVLYARPRVIGGLNELLDDEPAPELAIIAVKSYDTASIAPLLRRVCWEHTDVLTLQNGLGNEEALANALGAERIVAGSFTLSVSLSDKGAVLQHTGSGGIAYSELRRDEARRRPMQVALTTAGLRVRACPNWRAMKWSKLLLNILGNASCAILGMTPAELFASPRLFALEQRAFREARRVMHRLGLRPTNLPGYPVRLLCAAMSLPGPLARPAMAARVGGGRGAKLPSLALDLARGRGQSEVAYLNGAIAQAGVGCGVATPVNTLLAETLSAIAAGREDADRFRGRPEALLALLRASR